MIATTMAVTIRGLELRMKPGRILNAIRAAFVRTIWTLTRGVSDPAGGPVTGQRRGRPGRSRPSLPPSSL